MLMRRTKTGTVAMPREVFTMIPTKGSGPGQALLCSCLLGLFSGMCFAAHPVQALLLHIQVPLATADPAVVAGAMGGGVAGAMGGGVVGAMGGAMGGVEAGASFLAWGSGQCSGPCGRGQGGIYTISYQYYIFQHKII